jgi:hypothetical protein
MVDFSYCTERVKGTLLTMVKKLKSELTSVQEQKRMSIELKLDRSEDSSSAQTH